MNYLFKPGLLVILFSVLADKLASLICAILSKALFLLKLDHNLLTGQIPNFKPVQLAFIELNDNQLSGSIPNFNIRNAISQQSL